MRLFPKVHPDDTWGKLMLKGAWSLVLVDAIALGLIYSACQVGLLFKQ